MFKIGITGGSGYIGYNLAKYFLNNNFKVRILDIKPPKEFINGIEFHHCNIVSYKDIEEGLRDIDIVIHTAIVQIPFINEQKRLGYEVNVIGTQNLCEAVDKNPNIKGMILAGSWHVLGERGLSGVINEEFGYRPDKVEERAKLYALAKITQESIVRYFNEISDKVYGIIRMGTVLGEDMPEKTAANIFIEKGLKGETLTPFKHSMYRPMLYVDIEDICKVYERFVLKILNNEVSKEGSSLSHIVNVYYPQAITILELAEIVQKSIMKYTNNRICPKIEVVDTGQEPLFSKEDKDKIRVDITRAMHFLGLTELKSPRESIERIVQNRIKT